MSLLQLAWKNIIGDRFRSLAVFLCSALVAGLVLTATLVVQGAETSLRLNLGRLGADILVLPWGTITQKIGGAQLMSASIDGWIPTAYMDKVAALDGVAEVSPQLHLATLRDSPYSPELFMVAFDPATDFTVRPWLLKGVIGSLADGEAVAGAQITIPDGGDELSLFGSRLRLVDRLGPTGTSIDRTVFVSFNTAAQLAARSSQQEQENLRFMPGTASAIMVKVDLGRDPHEVAVRILENVHSVVPLETPNLFQAERRQSSGVLRTLLSLLAAIWAITVIFIGLVFSIAANERRWEIGVLRALGFTRVFVLKTLLMEGVALALTGGLAGVIATAITLVIIGGRTQEIAGLPLSLPSLSGFISLSLGGQLAALISVTLAAFIPAWRLSQQEVALTIRD